MATVKQKKLAKKLSENISANGKRTKSMGKMMLESGYSHSTSHRPSQVLKSNTFIKLLGKAGISDKLLAKKLMEGINATKVISCNVFIKDKDGNCSQKDAGGNTNDFIEVEDYGIRHRYLLTVLELKRLISRNGFNIHVGDRVNTYNQIMIERAPESERRRRKVETVDVTGKSEAK